MIERIAAVAATAMGSSPPNVVPLHPTADSAEYEDVFRRFRDGAQMGDAIRLDGLIAIITGGAGGIGGAIARLMAARGPGWWSPTFPPTRRIRSPTNRVEYKRRHFAPSHFVGDLGSGLID